MLKRRKYKKHADDKKTWKIADDGHPKKRIGQQWPRRLAKNSWPSVLAKRFPIVKWCLAKSFGQAKEGIKLVPFLAWPKVLARDHFTMGKRLAKTLGHEFLARRHGHLWPGPKIARYLDLRYSFVWNGDRTRRPL